VIEQAITLSEQAITLSEQAITLSEESITVIEQTVTFSDQTITLKTDDFCPLFPFRHFVLLKYLYFSFTIEPEDEKMTPEPGNKVFISYSPPRDTEGEEADYTTSDKRVADQICRRLESEGIRCWIAPRDILPGDSWLDSMIEAVKQCQIFILVFSANTYRSQWVKDEITLALNRNIKIIPFRIENISPQGTLEILQARCQWIDAYTSPLEKHLDRLTQAVRTHLDRDTKKQPPSKEEVPKPPEKPQIPDSKRQSQPKEEIPQKPTPPQAPVKKKRRTLPLKWIAAAASIIAVIVIAYIIQHLQTQTPEQKPPPPIIENTEEKQPEEIQAKQSSTKKKVEPAKKEDQAGLKKESQGGIPPDLKAVEEKADVKVIKNINGEDRYEADFGSGLIMVYIPPGTFTMGSNDYDDEKPPHDVYLDGYWLGKTEVTFDQYDRFCDETNRERPFDRGWGRGKRPVIYVSWNDANDYCEWLSKKTGLKFKLPSEAQWEKAARGSDGRKYPWGNHDPSYREENRDRQKFVIYDEK
jgi:formylglycine-generating enzyme required for sulfatase activity